MGSNSKKARRKKQARLIMLMSVAGILIVTVIAVCLIILVVKTTGLAPVNKQENETTTNAVASITTTAESVEDTQASVTEDTTAETIEITKPEEPTTAESTAPALTGDALLDAANLKAAMYDYDTAISMLTGSSEYATNTSYQQAVTDYEAAKAGLVKWADNGQITHIFFHSLIFDPNLSFGSEGDIAKYNKVMTTIPEFNEIMQEMYDRGYVIVSLQDIARMELQADGSYKMVSQAIYLPPGKQPFVISQDDVCYYEYMTGKGFANRLVVDTDGTVTCEMELIDGTVVRGSFDMIPILDDFIDLHPDFSYHGAKGIIALTGYNGVFGYRTSHYNYGPENEGRAGSGYLYPNYNIDADTETAKQVAAALKADGWTFATHSWGHRAMGSAAYENFVADLNRWMEEVIPIIGECDTVIYPFGDDIGYFWGYTNTEKQKADTLDKYTYMKNLGFNYFCNVDSNQYWVQITDQYMRQGRRNVDGQRLYEAICGYRNLLSDIIDVEKVWDWERPEPVEGVPVPEGYVIGSHSNRT
ncbi:MAG: polysaccharide deacetylase [Lachnospiraceae bacterium]|nr:polysaccharide deacetylase [Lachnospiraceae bacterium]